jgi:DNA-binding IclR family transcriptional regulator
MIHRIRDQINETVFLGVHIDRCVLVTAVAEAKGPLKLSATPGTLFPLFAGAMGKVFLAGRPTAWVIQQIRENGLPKYTPNSIVEEGLYLSELEKVRADGYAVDDEEYLSGVRAVAVALGNFNGPPMAALIAGLSGAMDEVKIELAIETATAMVNRLRPALDNELSNQKTVYWVNTT